MCREGERADSLIIRAKWIDGAEVKFRVWPKTDFGLLKDVFAQKLGLDSEDIVFLFDGNRLSPCEQISDYNVVEGDVIDVVFQQWGC